ncbi:PTS sugar transporter subunit IIB [Shouchella clausii]|jgi:cellobiose PTS system EIIB component|uniref:B component PTS system diacetylchitobiose-specific enzyme II n=3 Tax=Shouchella TaxID=2893057 RepID=Q5WBR1_SHOC1|nr:MULTISPECIES: PTS sugar transporter subunit IIB [Shouchella]MCM3311007.1 PTS sugar transporter subunit IIB [Psychrobacillus sp. MER TA 17]ALA53377.1 PTS system, diacetylchitobiose-specific IIB component [Shouchella clausii]KKI86039.1 PTS cellobiose transporter subunit IIB [Shouchella clausii]MBU3233253.1 PTS sugar transporter subunit IIB [Shouchella clausii]MBU3263893.1 PTS sugar transporter subunit IIB [Shouchella clausii]
MTKVLFVCSGGMSSAIVVNTLKKEAEKHGQALEVKAIGSSEVAAELENNWDVVMVAPQIKHRFDNIKKEADAYGVPCGPIPPQAYTPLGGPTLLKTLQELVK